MDDVTKQATLSAVRTILVAIGSGLAARGYLTAGTAQELVGAVMVLVPAALGIWDKYQVEHRTAAREHIAVNAGIALSDATIGKTEPVAAPDVRMVIQAFAPAGLEGQPKGVTT